MNTGRPAWYDDIDHRRQLLAFRLMQRHQSRHTVMDVEPSVLLVTHRDVGKYFLEWLVPSGWDPKLTRDCSVTKIVFRPGCWGLDLELDRDMSHVSHLLGSIYMRPLETDPNTWRQWPGESGNEAAKTKYYTPSDQPGNKA